MHLLKSFSGKRHKNGFAYALRPRRAVYRLTSPGDVPFVWVFQKLCCFKALCCILRSCLRPLIEEGKKNQLLEPFVPAMRGAAKSRRAAHRPLPPCIPAGCAHCGSAELQLEPRCCCRLPVQSGCTGDARGREVCPTWTEGAD